MGGGSLNTGRMVSIEAFESELNDRRGAAGRAASSEAEVALVDVSDKCCFREGVFGPSQIGEG
jgi:hypothetical protein